MKYNITVEFTVSKLKNPSEAREMGNAIAEHVLDTFNDNKSISNLVYVSFKEVTK